MTFCRESVFPALSRTRSTRKSEVPEHHDAGAIPFIRFSLVPALERPLHESRLLPAVIADAVDVPMEHFIAVPVPRTEPAIKLLAAFDDRSGAFFVNPDGCVEHRS